MLNAEEHLAFGIGHSALTSSHTWKSLTEFTSSGPLFHPEFLLFSIRRRLSHDRQEINLVDPQLLLIS